MVVKTPYHHPQLNALASPPPLPWQVMKNVGAILEAAGSSWDKVVKTTILMARIEDYAAINDIYGEMYMHSPAAKTVLSLGGDDLLS